MQYRIYLHQWVIHIATRADVQIHVVPVKVLQLLGGEIHAGDFVGLVLWGMEAVPVVHVYRGVRVSEEGIYHYYYESKEFAERFNNNNKLSYHV